MHTHTLSQYDALCVYVSAIETDVFIDLVVRLRRRKDTYIYMTYACVMLQRRLLCPCQLGSHLCCAM